MLFNIEKNLLVGQGQTTIATARYLQHIGASFSIFSLKPNTLPNDLSQFYTQVVSEYTQAWISPGIALDDPVMNCLDQTKTCLDIDYFLTQYKKPVILVTGTNGKSTVCRYLQTMFLALGLKSVCYGNYQPGILFALEEDIDWVIIELSSYQLERMCYQGTVALSILLNISEDHIDWHGSMKDYQQSKMKIHKMAAINMGVGGEDYKHHMQAYSHLPRSKALNLAASIAILKKLGYKAPMVELPVLPYREMTYKVNDQVIINDSKSTTIASTVSALNNAVLLYPQQRVLLILGGIEKSNYFQPLIDCLNLSIQLIVIGKGFQDLDPFIEQRFDCIYAAISCIIRYKGVILFSPGGASYDQYKTYMERGRDFDRCILSIQDG